MSECDLLWQSLEEAEIEPASEQPFYKKVLSWMRENLGSAGFGKPFSKRLALLICGLVRSQRARVPGHKPCLDLLWPPSALAHPSGTAGPVLQLARITLQPVAVPPAIEGGTSTIGLCT